VLEIEIPDNRKYLTEKYPTTGVHFVKNMPDATKILDHTNQTDDDYKAT
jgi:hypothetical protein